MKWFNIFLLSLLLVSCKKETKEIETQTINLNTDFDVRDLIFVNDTLAYACGGHLWDGGFIAESTDGGNSWEIVYNHVNAVFKLAYLNDSNIVAGTHYGGLITTANGGKYWGFVNNPEYGAINDLTFLNDTTLFFATGESYHFGGVVQSHYITGEYQFQNLEKSVNSLYFFNENEAVFGAYGLIYKSTDGGKTLNATNATNDFFVDIDFDNNGNGLAVGYQGKIMYSNNYGNTWKQIEKKSHFFTSKGNLTSVALNNNEAFIAGQNGVLFYSNNFTNDWIKVNHPYKDYDINKIVLKDNHTAYGMGSNGLLFKFNY